MIRKAPRKSIAGSKQSNGFSWMAEGNEDKRCKVQTLSTVLGAALQADQLSSEGT